MKNILRFGLYLQTFLLSVDSVLTALFGETNTNRIINEFPINTERRALENASLAFNLKKRGVK